MTRDDTREAIATTKRFVDLASLPDDKEIQPAWDAFTELVVKPDAHARLGALVPLGLQQRSEVEAHLGYYVELRR